MIRKIIIIVIVALISFNGCVQQNKELKDIEFYILRHVENSKDYIREDKPVFTVNDIKTYDWNLHKIVFNSAFIDKNDYSDSDDAKLNAGSLRLNAFYPDMFEVYVDGTLIYNGFFMPQIFISFMPRKPTIEDTPEGIIIEQYIGDIDYRNNDVLYRALKSYGVISE